MMDNQILTENVYKTQIIYFVMIFVVIERLKVDTGYDIETWMNICVPREGESFLFIDRHWSFDS